MKWLGNLIAPVRPHLFALVGVLAVAGVGTAIIAYAYIAMQREHIETQAGHIDDLTEVNKEWAKHAAEQDRIRALEQQNALLLQDKLTLIEHRSERQNQQIEELEATNAEVKEFMSRRIPDDLKRLLGK